MLYRIGTKQELPTVASRLPESVYTELLRSTAILDAEYGESRNYLQIGGYSVIVETCDDLAQLKAIVDYDIHPYEWVTKIGKDSGNLSVLYLLNDDYSIVVYLPAAIAPNAILNELED